ncbi:MAG: hypothetical protein ACKVWR_21930 [Acidimicrobiales bacterium]
MDEQMREALREELRGYERRMAQAEQVGDEEQAGRMRARCVEVERQLGNDKDSRVERRPRGRVRETREGV